jgi:hypothetical protein
MRADPERSLNRVRETRVGVMPGEPTSEPLPVAKALNDKTLHTDAQPQKAKRILGLGGDRRYHRHGSAGGRMRSPPR